jgi:hypothetical protein
VHVRANDTSSSAKSFCAPSVLVSTMESVNVASSPPW